MQTTLRKVGGSVMFAIPPAILRTMNLNQGLEVDMAVDSGRLIITAHNRPRYTLEELLNQCDLTAAIDADRDWLDSTPVGREII